jgi:hypothetical protein
MATITAIFDSDSAAHRAIDAVKSRGVEDGRISYLTPGDSPKAADSARGIGKPGGTALGGVLGMGAATFIMPVLGPIAGVGLLAGALAGAVLGAAAGKAADRKLDVRDHDLFFFEDALRRGMTVVIVDVHGDAQETQVRNILEREGGRSADSLRREWWQSVRAGERDYVRQRGYDFDAEEINFRSGFEGALHPQARGREFDEVVAYLESCYPEPCRTEVFRVGFDRGRQYLQGRTGGRELH